MRELLVIDLALCAVLIMVTALIVIGHRRRSRRRPSTLAKRRHERPADPVARPMAGPGTTVVPGLSADGVQPDLGVQPPAEPEPAAEPKINAEPRAEAQAEAQAEPQASAVAGPVSGTNGQRPSPNGLPAAAKAVTTRDQIGSYYDDADRPMSDYLAALGWTGDPATHHPREAAALVDGEPGDGGGDRQKAH